METLNRAGRNGEGSDEETLNGEKLRDKRPMLLVENKSNVKQKGGGEKTTE